MSFTLRDPHGLAGRLPGLTGRGWEDGYDWRDKQKGWHIPGSWGRDGWDLGIWPYTMYGWVDVEESTYAACLHCGVAPGEVASFNPCPGRGEHQYGDPAAYGYLSYCEGDIDVIVFATREERDTELDKAALFHWVHRSDSWVEAIAKRRGKALADLTVDDLPARLRGHFSWARLDREKPLTTKENNA